METQLISEVVIIFYGILGIAYIGFMSVYKTLENRDKKKLDNLPIIVEHPENIYPVKLSKEKVTIQNNINDELKLIINNDNISCNDRITLLKSKVNKRK